MFAKPKSQGQGAGEGEEGARLRPKRRRKVPTEDTDPQKNGDESATPDSDSKYERKYFWSHHTESGFPNRVNHAVAACRGPNGDYTLYSLGGYHADDDERTVIQADTMGGPFFRSSPIDVHCLDVDCRTWTRIDPPPSEKYIATDPYQRAKIPGCRYGHTVCHYQGRLYMYGGRNDEDGSFSSVECYDLATNVWLKLLCAGEAPSSRDGHACASIGSEMIIHGGFSAREIRFSGDMFAFNMASHTWRKLPHEGDYVRERDFHTATAVNNKIVTFGGRSDMFAPFFTANDVYDDVFYCYDLDDLKWQKMPTTGYKVIGRRSHCAANLGNNIIYFGGYNARTKQHFGDVFILNTDTCLITEVRPFGSAPLPRRRVGAALAGTELVICGGTSPVEVVRKGKRREILHDHNDMYILQLLPTLQQCCLTYIIQEKVDYSPLPTFMQERIATIMNTPLQTVTSVAQYESG